MSSSSGHACCTGPRRRAVASSGYGSSIDPICSVSGSSKGSKPVTVAPRFWSVVCIPISIAEIVGYQTSGRPRWKLEGTHDLRAAHRRAPAGDDPPAPPRRRCRRVRPARIPRRHPRRGRVDRRVHQGGRLLELQEQGRPLPRAARRPHHAPARRGVGRARGRSARAGGAVPAHPRPAGRGHVLGRRLCHLVPRVRALRAAPSRGASEARGERAAVARARPSADRRGVRHDRHAVGVRHRAPCGDLPRAVRRTPDRPSRRPDRGDGDDARHRARVALRRTRRSRRVAVGCGARSVERETAMKFMVECPVLSDVDGGAWLDPDNIAEFARTAEESGIDAVSFTDHPAPSKQWLDTGGHETFDPFVSLAFCAAATRTIKVMTHLIVVPYRNPLLMARSMTSLDVLSKGRAIFTLGTGYLRSEFAALGVDFDERNELFDEAIEVLHGVWSTDDFAYDGRHFKAIGQILKPGPVARPYPTLWLGGNAKIVLDRVARWGDGWAPLLTGGSTLARTTRTALIEDEDKLLKLIGELTKRL